MLQTEYKNISSQLWNWLLWCGCLQLCWSELPEPVALVVLWPRTGIDLRQWPPSTSGSGNWPVWQNPGIVTYYCQHLLYTPLLMTSFHVLRHQQVLQWLGWHSDSDEMNIIIVTKWSLLTLTHLIPLAQVFPDHGVLVILFQWPKDPFCA